MLEAYPLTWPVGRERTPAYARKQARFNVPFGQARDELLVELGRLGAHDIVVSTNVQLRRDGLPYADAREPDDPGAAVYFNRRKKPYVIACDTYNRVKFNLRAIGATVEALRAIERHGASQMLEQAFSGFAALPPARLAEASWWDVLGVGADATLEEIDGAYERLALEHHPDRGGDDDQMARVNRARDIAHEERGL